jgi:hypothetical protein
MATEWPTIRVDTKYGPLAVRITAGPTRAPGGGYLSDHGYPNEAHAFGREPDAPTLGAYAGTADGGHAPELTINGIGYGASAHFALREPKGYETGTDWREEYGGGSPLHRSGSWLADEPTEGARKVWREVIAPAIIAALRTASQECTEAQALARAAFVADCKARAAALRAEADRLEGLMAWIETLTLADDGIAPESVSTQEGAEA